MALLIEKQTLYGVPATYWRIISAQIDFGRNDMKVFMAGYASEVARESGAVPITQEQISFDIASLGPDQVRGVVYAAVKQLEEWSGASDA